MYNINIIHIEVVYRILTVGLKKTKKQQHIEVVGTPYEHDEVFRKCFNNIGHSQQQLSNQCWTFLHNIRHVSMVNRE